MREALQQNIEQRLQQSLSPLQLQFSRILEMSAQEFDDESRRQLDENPALAAGDEDIRELSPLEDEDQGRFNETAEQMQLADYASDDDIPSYRLEAHNSSADSPVYEPMAVNPGVSLADWLVQQISELRIPDRDRALAVYVAGNIDGNGYLTRSPEEMSNDLAFNEGVEVDASEIAKAVAVVQSLDPPGVGGADLRQTLRLQLERKDEAIPGRDDALLILDKHYEWFVRKHFDRLEQVSGLPHERLAAAVALLRSLNPKPGTAYDSTDPRTRQIIPDFEVIPDDSGHLLVTLPGPGGNMHLDAQYDLPDDAIDTARKGNDRRTAEAMAFVKRKRDEAVDFLTASRMRRETLLRVMEAIVRLQQPFFNSGDPSQLRPMVLKDVAALTGDDLSVISRAASGKYVSTPNGVFPLKFFFNERPKEESDTSVREVMDALRKLMESEDHKHPYSDEQLAALLRDQGYDIARRTVAKYRERLGFAVARLRREL